MFGQACGDLVIAEFGKHRTVVAAQQVDVPGGVDLRDRLQRAITHDSQHHVPQLVGHGILVSVRRAQRRPNLGAGIGPGGQLQVPSGI